MLPTGDVLVTGGVRDNGDLAGQRVPQVWSEATGWSDSTTLAPEPVYRNYHGTAILLPDGRVMTGGGAFVPTSPLKGCVYEPSYLFDAADAYIRQTLLTGVPGAAYHGQVITAGTQVPGDVASISSACLVMPSSVSHDVNFSQRFVPLEFTVVAGGLRLQLPASPNLAPPGDYMLFVTRQVEGKAVPSIARWLRLLRSDDVPPATPSPFTAAFVSGDTHLHWGANVEPDLSGYRLYRGTSADFAPGPASLIASLSDTGWVDAGEMAQWYKLAAVDLAGQASAFAVLGPDETLHSPPPAPAEVALGRPMPNPTRDQVRFDLSLPRPAVVRLDVLDAAGRHVRSLAHGPCEAGALTFVWDGRDGRGRAVAGGRYFLRLEADGRTLTRSLSLTR